MKRRGRPQSYDLDRVLDAAIGVFWTEGYEGASMDGLTKAMGINRPSIYARFGNKHGLFLSALDRYIMTSNATLMRPLIEEGVISAAVEEHFREIIRLVTSEDGPRGCLITSVAAEIAQRDEVVRQKISTLYKEAEELLDARLAREGYRRTENGAAPVVTGAMIITAGQSFAPRARLGASRSELEEIAKGFVSAFFRDLTVDTKSNSQVLPTR